MKKFVLENSKTCFHQAETRFQKAETRFQRAETRFQKAETRFLKAETRFQNGKTPLSRIFQGQGRKDLDGFRTKNPAFKTTFNKQV